MSMQPRRILSPTPGPAMYGGAGAGGRRVKTNGPDAWA